MEGPRLIVRLSPSERVELREKTNQAGLSSMSDAVRAAIADWRPMRDPVVRERDPNVIHEAGPRELTMVRDE